MNEQNANAHVSTATEFVQPIEWLPDPEDFRPRPRKPIQLFQRWPAAHHALLPFALLLVAGLLSSLVWGGNLPSLAISGETLFAGDIWRAVTALFVHADEAHLLSNAILFVGFGTLLHAYFGTLAFPVLPFLAGTITNALVVTLYDANVRLLGLSGMIYAMAAIWLVYYLRFETDKSFARRTLRVIGFSLLMLFPQGYDPKVSYLAHSTGFVSGAVIGMIALPYVSLKDPRI